MIHVHESSVILKEINWSKIPKPFIETILAELKIENPSMEFKYLNSNIHGGIIIAAKTNSEIAKEFNKTNVNCNHLVSEINKQKHTKIPQQNKTIDWTRFFSI